MKLLRTVSAGVIAGTLLCVSASAFDITFGEKGIVINADAMGSFDLSYPKLVIKGDSQKTRGPIEKKLEGRKATLKYEGGIEAVLERDGGNVSILFSNADALEKYRMEMLIPFNFRDGGRWKAGDQEGDFPVEKPSKPQFYQANSSTLQITSDTGKVLSMKIPPWSYQQLQDNREWGWNIYHYLFHAPFDRNNPRAAITIRPGPLDRSDKAAPEAQDTSGARIDKFGQAIRKDFPGKVKSEQELKADVQTEKAYYASLMDQKLDACGGLPGSGERIGLKKTGFFHVEKKGARWVLVDPEGNAFFHLGICGFGPSDDYTYVEGRSEIYEWLPPRGGEFAAAWHPNNWWNPRAVSFYKANVIRKYGTFDDDANTRRLIERVRKLGFNSAGAFSGISPVFKETNFPCVRTLPLGQWTLGKMIPGVRGIFDPFDEETLKKMDELFSKSLPANADDPLTIGYFLDNEQAFEDLPRAIPALDGRHQCKLRLVEMLRDRHKDISAFNSAWGMKAASFDVLKNQGLPVSTKAAFGDMQAYTELFLETYYRSITGCFRKYDKNHMLTGNRWQPGTANNELLCRIAGKYMDVISINYYTSGIDSVFVRRLYEWTGQKPQMWSEFYYTAEKESTVSGSGHDVPTQKERGLAYRNYVEGAASLGFVVGIEWFTLIDQAATGRFFEKYNGERNNTGIFNVCDRSYKDMAAEMMKTHQSIYGVWLEGKAPYVFDNPLFTAKAEGAARSVQAGRATGPMKTDCRLDGWPGRPPERIGGNRLVLGRESGGLEAVFKVCWDESNLYLLADITDATPMMNEREGAGLWSADGLELFIGSEKLDQGGTLLFTDRQILLGAGKNARFHVANAAEQPAVETAVVPGVDGKGYTLEAAIPWSVLAVKPKADLHLLFDLAVDNSDDGKGRTCQLMWNGGARNSTDRGGWGRLILTP